MIKRRPDKEWFYEHYITQGLTQKEIASLLDCVPSTVSTWLKNMGISRKSKLHLNEEWLYEHYVTKNLGPSEIARISGTNASAVCKALTRYGIKKPTKFMMLGNDSTGYNSAARLRKFM